MPFQRDGQREERATVMAFIDSGYLTAAARKLFGLQGPVRLVGEEVADWPEVAWVGPQRARILRTYVYDGARPPEDPGYAEQRSHFDELGAAAGIRLRLGHMTERQAGTGRARYEQKGVDTLLVLDVVRMAQQRAFDTALVVAGDRDLAEALRVIADDYARRVVVYGVEGSEPHKDLRHAADAFSVIERHHLTRMVGLPHDAPVRLGR